MSARTREALLDAAAGIIMSGRPATMSGVAAAAGVSRQTVYNEFGGREDLLRALSLREGRRILADVVRAAREAPGDVGDVVSAATVVGLRAAADDPLVKAGVVGGTELLPFVTTAGGALLTLLRDGCAEVLLDRWPTLDPAETRWAVEMGVRLALSHLVLHTEPIEVTAAHAAIMMRRLLGPTDRQTTDSA
jgi:AcrR family transcriptional regulator